MTLSIITINYNNLEGLRRTIDSVISQTWHDFEWIIIDGGSTDGSKELIEDTANELAASDFNPLSYWCSEPDKGIFNALNKGVGKAIGQYVNFLNSGDVYTEQDVLERVFKDKAFDCDVIYGDWQDIANGEILNKWSSGAPLTLKQELLQCTCHQALFINAEGLKKDPYDESYKMMADWRKNIAWLMQGKTFVHVPVIVCYYDLTGVSSQFDSEPYQEEKSRMIAELFPPCLIPYYNYLIKGQDLIANMVTKEIISEYKLANSNRVSQLLFRIARKFAKIYNKL